MAQRNDPYSGFNFLIEIDGVVKGGFSECSGLTSDTNVIEYREGNEKQLTARQIPGLMKYTHIVLKRGYSSDQSLWTWRQRVIDGNVDRRSGSITLLDDARNPALTWNFREGWPSKLDGPSLNAKTSDVAIETLEICHEGIELAS
ncbi:MAG: phage tail protein [Acidobacteriaceae bacterium]|nr:phage tail protein [Acidobacteriaceae bacterium]